MASHNSAHTLPRDLTVEIVELIKSNLSDDFRDQYLGTSLLSKFADPNPEALLRRQNAALSKWLGVENRNSRTNTRVLLAEDTDIVGELSVGKVLDFARSIIRKLLGASPPLEELLGSFSGGASTSKKREPGVIGRKFAERPDVTHKAWDYVETWLKSDHDIWLQYNTEVLNPRFMRGNVMFFVPKNDEIERVACKEPDLNMFIQKGVGKFLRQRLRTVGVDLNDQGLNQAACKSASMANEYATVDLSSASDTITTQLVCRLLPTDWFHFLDCLRCGETRLPKELTGGKEIWHENEMFASMGNGFIFELESMVFYALVTACGILSGKRGRVNVYGDDLIFRSDLVGQVEHIFGYVGFKLNRQKSFSRGPFRESCGKHYLRGVDVTPFYL